ncbi:hypothetical protein BOTBODRAFT_178543 [Botryobasidium botryosum FD-172 SS1]|uniref:Cytochrome P450 n=1 Tax=Botryobasidium botryosum (strain FD-172 SS1) TaxID=930990 RepID=A0A067M2J0_BOTB1|nr:hypothetical protein BOTBODRAFT_178543 [Botryobasidium botryosum FD-172 SS1]
MLQALLACPTTSAVALFALLLAARRFFRFLHNRYTTDIRYVPKPVSASHPPISDSLFAHLAAPIAPYMRISFIRLRRRTQDGGDWLWGHEMEPWSKPYGEVYSSWFDKHGPIVRMSGALGHDDILAVADPGVLSHMLTKNVYGYSKSPIIRPIIDRLLGKSLPWAEGDEHRRMRALLNPVFTAEQTRGMYDDVKLATDHMVSKLVNHLRASGGDAIIRTQEWTSNATLDVIGRVGFGHDFRCGESIEAKKIAAAWHETVSLGLTKAGRIAPLIIRTFPIIVSLPIPAIQSQGATKLTVRALAEELYVKASADPESIKGKDLLSTLIRANFRERRNISKDELLDHICTFVMVGHETTAGALNFTLLALAQNPDMQAKLRKELIEFGSEPTYDDFLTKLPYLDAVTKESFRMFPVTAHTERVAVKDDVIPLRKPIFTPEGQAVTSLRIKKGQLFHIPELSIDRMNAVWGDGATFRPDRWTIPGQLPAPSELTQGWSNLFAFLEGPRMCLGFRLALLEYKFMLTSLIKTFVFHDTGAKIEAHWSNTLQPKVVGEEGVNLPLRVTLADN